MGGKVEKGKEGEEEGKREEGEEEQEEHVNDRWRVKEAASKKKAVFFIVYRNYLWRKGKTKKGRKTRTRPIAISRVL